MNPVIRRYAQVSRQRWRWPLWGVLVALALVTAAVIWWPPQYQVHAKVFVRTPGDVSRVMDGGDSYAQTRANTYSALAKSENLTSRVIADLGLDLDASTLSRRVRAAAEPGTALMDVVVGAPSAEEAQRTATVLLSELAETVRTLESVPGSLVPRAELVVVDQPQSPSRVVLQGLPIPFAFLGAAVAGLFVGLLGGVLRSTLSGSAEVRTDEEIASAQAAAPPDTSAPDAVGTNFVTSTVSTGDGAPRHRRARHSPVRATED